MLANLLSTAWGSFADYAPFLHSSRRTQSTNELPLPVAHKQLAPTRGQNRVPARTPIVPRGLIKCGPSPPARLSTTNRAEYSRHGCTVYGWPSTGGVVARSNCGLVELSFFGWDPLEAPESRNEDQEQEDAFCAKLRMIGGKWWSSRRRFLDVTEEEYLPEHRKPTEDELREVYIGWPEGGGVLILENVNDELHWEIASGHDDGGEMSTTKGQVGCRVL
jgi:hypothetical protein